MLTEGGQTPDSIHARQQERDVGYQHKTETHVEGPLHRVPVKGEFGDLAKVFDDVGGSACDDDRRGALATEPHQESEANVLNNNLDEFLRQFVEGLTQRDPRYFPAFVDLNGDQRDEAIVHLVGPEMCGTGRCVTLVHTPGRVGSDC